MRAKLLFIFLITYCFASATHNRGGYIRYSYAGGGKYIFRIYTWTDAASVAGDRCNLNLFIDNTDTLVCNRINGTNPCPNGGTGVDGVIIVPGASGYGGVKENIYESQTPYFLPVGSHILTVIDPNRESGIINMGGTNSQNIAFAIMDSVYVYGLAGMTNISPIITNSPIDNICAGANFYYDPGMVDPDNDSLSYSIIRSFEDDPNNAPFGVQQIASETIPAGMSINPQTGLLAWNAVPTIQGEYDISILVKEYKMDKTYCQRLLVSQTVLNIPLHVVACPSMSLLFTQSPQDVCISPGATYTAQVHVLASGGVTSPITLVAQNPVFSSTTIGTDPLFTPTSFSMSATGTFSWQPTCQAVQKLPYQFIYRASDNSSLQNANYFVQSVSVVCPAPSNFSVSANGNSASMSWSPLSLCGQTAGNTLIAYDIYRVDSCMTYVPTACQVGVPAGAVSVTSTYTTATSYTETNVPNGSHTYFVLGRFADCTRGIAAAGTCVTTVGIKSFEANNQFSVSPNPGKGNFKIKFDNAASVDREFSVRDILGNEVLGKQKFPADRNEINLDLSGVSGGIYFIVMIDRSGSLHSIKKIVIE